MPPNASSSRFKPATRAALRLRMAIDGPSGSGKSVTALRFAHALRWPNLSGAATAGPVASPP